MSHRSQETDAQGYPFAGFSPPALDPNMQEDRQPNETRMQRKGDHRVPKVQSSANPRHSLHRSSRPSSYPLPRRPNNPQNKKLWHRKLAPRGDGAGFMVTSDDLPRGQGSNRRRGFSPPPPRDSNSAQDKSVANRQPAMNSVSMNPSVLQQTSIS